MGRRTVTEYEECPICGGWAIIKRAREKGYRDRTKCTKCGITSVRDNIPPGQHFIILEENEMRVQ